MQALKTHEYMHAYILMCPTCSPDASTGIEYEALLCEKLRNYGIPFFSEDALREQGFYKTPDVKLQVRSHFSDAAPLLLLGCLCLLSWHSRHRAACAIGSASDTCN